MLVAMFINHIYERRWYERELSRRLAEQLAVLKDWAQDDDDKDAGPPPFEQPLTKNDFHK